MSRKVYEARGAIEDGVTIVLDAPLPVRGRVKVQVEAETTAPDSQNLWEFLETLHAQQHARGHIPPTPETVETYLRELRSEWRDDQNLPR
ncbi:MAG: hypothetical protein CFK49_10195 [Armatimonadetes bacterium JP3_11]|jgi:selenocysteine-specific translation elongation factor|nr:MAG: hypothetical protein CFK49_10195 [Armatimonadetes bacterium JP3_11]RMH10392.1 MAG: hypothetical protein D6697_01165 [Armatimonadota bacterium]